MKVFLGLLVFWLVASFFSFIIDELNLFEATSHSQLYDAILMGVLTGLLAFFYFKVFPPKPKNK